jgi:hypothetical protein
MKLRLMMCTIAAAMAPATVLLTASGTALAQPVLQSRTATPATPAINGFNVEEVARLDQGVRLQFDLYGTPGGNATLNLDGANRALHLTEVEPGQYTGSYVIGTRDRLKADSRVTAELRMGNEVVTSVLREPLVRGDVAQPADDTRQLATKDSRIAAAAPGAAPPPAPRTTERPRVARYCTSCGIIEKVETVQGALSNPRPLASDATARQYFRVTVRMNTTDTTQVLEFANNPGYRTGDRVRVSDGVLTLDKQE